MRRGFTIIELLVVMTLIALLLTIAAPRYFQNINSAKEAVLRENLFVMRDALDKYRADKGAYPSSLNDLVTERYLRAVPHDPITERIDSWVLIPPKDGERTIFNVRSGAEGTGRDGRPYASL